MKVLLTGGAGFIGSHVADRLIARGDEVTVLDNLTTGQRSNLPPEARFVEMDIRSGELYDLWHKESFEVLLHFAAQMSVSVSVKDPLYDADVNIRGLLNLMEAGRSNGLKRVVFASTGGAGYDDDVPFPTPESAPSRPKAPYGIGKVASELYLRYYSMTHNIAHTALRFGNVFGPRQNPHGEAGVVAIFARKFLLDQVPTIHGDGLQTRDYIYVGNVADAFLGALDSGVEGVFNIGSAVETTVVEVARRLRAIVGTELEPIHDEAQPGEVRRSMLAIDKAREELGWTPRIDLDEGLRQTVEYFRQAIHDPDHR